MNPKKKNKTDQIKDVLKAVRKESREKEIKMYGKSIRYSKIGDSPKKYKRSKRVDLNDVE